MAGTPHRAHLNKFALGTALALVMTPLAGVEQANATCAPASGQDNVTVTCTTNTSGQDGNNGFGQGTEKGVTLTVNSGVTVTGVDNGIILGDNATVTVQSTASVVMSNGGSGSSIHVGSDGTINNAGSITGDLGIQGDAGGLTVHNSGTVTSAFKAIHGNAVTVDNSNQIESLGTAIFGQNTVTVTSNTGTIDGGDFGIVAATVNITNGTGGSIIGSHDGSIAIQGQTVTVNSNGTILGDAFGINATSTATVTNGVNGNIGAAGLNGIGGIAIGDNASTPANKVTLDNAGLIQAENAGGIAVRGQTVTVNSNTGGIFGDTFGINATGTATVTNNGGSIEAIAAHGIAIGANTVTLDNAGVVDSETTGGIAVRGQTVNVNSNTREISGDAIGINATGTATVTNNAGGTIRALGAGGIAIGDNATTPANTVTLDNAGRVMSALGAGGIAVRGQTVNVNSNTGSIFGDVFGINATGTATVTNNAGGAIQAENAGGIAIGDNAATLANTVTLDNAGTVRVVEAGGIAVQGKTVTVNSNFGDITGDAFGIHATGAATVTNNAFATIQALGAGGIAIGDNAATLANTVTLDNTGSVVALGAGGIAVQGKTVTVDPNFGDITGNAFGIHASDTANVINANNITATASDGQAIQGKTVTVNNLASGIIAGGENGGRGVAALSTLALTNAGQISADTAVIANDSATVNNLAGGTLQGTSFGINTGTLTLTNFGLISATTAIKATGAATITNFGTIQSTAGAGGTAIQLSNAADTLNIKKGSSIVGLIDMGGGADVINVDGSGASAPKGVSMLSRATSVVVDALKQQLENFTGVINLGGTSVQPSVTVNGLTASLDPTALAQQDRALMDFTGGMSSMAQDRLRGLASGGAGGPMAMSYAMEDAHAQMFNKALAPSWNAPVTVWSSAFGAVRSQNGTDTTLDSSSNVAGGVIGVDRRIRPDWLVGMFAGGGSGAINVDLASQKVDTDYFSVGAYTRFEWASQFFDATLQGGGINNRSSRLVQNTVTGGLDHATASYNGWFVSPEIAYGYRLNVGNGYVLTPTARLRYLAGLLDGYSEIGSAETLSVGSRRLSNFEERGELELSRTTSFFGGDHVLKTTFHGGVIGLQRAGAGNVSAILIGQGLTFATPGGNSAGGVFGVAFDYHMSRNASLFGGIEVTALADSSRTAAARGGLRVAF